jgi:hypothetical protein
VWIQHKGYYIYSFWCGLGRSVDHFGWWAHQFLFLLPQETTPLGTHSNNKLNLSHFLSTLTLIRHTLDEEGRGSNFLGTNLKQIESLSWTRKPWSVAWFLVLQIQELSPFSTLFWSEPIDFPSKTGAPCRFSLNLPLFGLGPSSKKPWDQFKSFWPNKIAWIHWSLDLRYPRLKSP